jgi:hypothetical protein
VCTGPVSNAISPPPRITIKLNDINDNKPQVTTTEITGITENTSKVIGLVKLKDRLQIYCRDRWAKNFRGKMTMKVTRV